MCKTVQLVLAACALAAAAAEEDTEVAFSVPPATGAAYHEGFQGEGGLGSFSKSNDGKYAGQEVSLGAGGLPGIYAADKGLILQNPAKRYGLTGAFDSPIGTKGGEGDFVLQYELRLNNGLECGGAYVKLVDADGFDAAALKDDTPYIIMFGPDKCGATNKVHFILRHRNPVSNKWEEKHFKTPPAIAEDRTSHLYTLVVRKDNSFEIFVDQQSRSKGSLLADMDPPVNPEKEIDDPDDKKPADWVDEEKIKDPEASKPDDWDEDEPYEIEDPDASKPSGWLDDAPLKIPDPEAKKPDDWDDEEDGEFEAPTIDNPACTDGPGCGEWKKPFIKNPKFKGKWTAPLIDNPAYKGVWKPRRIENPAYFVDESPAALPAMGGVAVEVWTMQGGLQFDNFYVGHDEAAAKAFGEATWAKKSAFEAQFSRDAAAKIKREERERMKKEGGALGHVQVLALDSLDVMAENVVASMLTAIALVVGLLYFCCKGGPEDEEDVAPTGSARRDDDDDEAEGKTEAEGEGEGEGDEAEDGEDETKSSKSPAKKPVVHRSVTATTDLKTAGAEEEDEQDEDDEEEGKTIAGDEDEEESPDKSNEAGDDDDDDDDDDDSDDDDDDAGGIASRVRRRRTRKVD